MNRILYIVSTIIFFVIGFFVQLLSIVLKNNLSNDVFCVLATSSCIPMAISEFSLIKILPPKYASIKYFLYIHIAGMLLGFALICIIAVFSEVKVGIS